jgi:hypothetical protein
MKKLRNTNSETVVLTETRRKSKIEKTLESKQSESLANLVNSHQPSKSVIGPRVKKNKTDSPTLTYNDIQKKRSDVFGDRFQHDFLRTEEAKKEYKDKSCVKDSEARKVTQLHTELIAQRHLEEIMGDFENRKTSRDPRLKPIQRRKRVVYALSPTHAPKRSNIEEYYN